MQYVQPEGESFFASRVVSSETSFLLEPSDILLPWLSSDLKYNLLPAFFSCANHWDGRGAPLIKPVLESYFLTRLGTRPVDEDRRSFDLRPAEKANMALDGESLASILSDRTRSDEASAVLFFKGDYLVRMLEARMKGRNFQDVLSSVLEKNRFSVIDLETFAAELDGGGPAGLIPLMDEWRRSSELPEFRIGEVRCDKVWNGLRECYQVTVTAANVGEVDGLLSIRAVIPGTSYESRNVEERLLELGPGKAKRAGIVLERKCTNINVNTLISKNLPSELYFRVESVGDRGEEPPFDGEEEIEPPSFKEEPGTIVVDDLDPGFEIVERQQTGLLARLFSRERKDGAISFRYGWGIKSRWTPSLCQPCFGGAIRCAHLIKCGGGRRKVAWNASLEEGEYDLYFYMPPLLPLRSSWSKKRADQLIYHFTVYHDGKIDERAVSVADMVEGWNFIGSYWLSEGEARVELSDRSKAKKYCIIADAMKWVRR